MRMKPPPDFFQELGGCVEVDFGSTDRRVPEISGQKREFSMQVDFLPIPLYQAGDGKRVPIMPVPA